jgi:hypothetical protein
MRERFFDDCCKSSFNYPLPLGERIKVRGIPFVSCHPHPDPLLHAGEGVPIYHFHSS